MFILSRRVYRENMSMDLHRSVVFKCTYIRPVQVAIAIRRSRAICRTQDFLECYCEHVHVTEMTETFARAMNDPSLADPANFLQQVDDAVRRSRGSD
jgi:hypothetical protein